MWSSATSVVSARRREINELVHVVFCNLSDNIGAGGSRGTCAYTFAKLVESCFFRSHRNDQRAPQSLVLGGGSDADMQGVALSMGADRSGRGRCALPQKMDVHVKRHEDKRTVGQMPHRLANADSEKGKGRE